MFKDTVCSNNSTSTHNDHKKSMDDTFSMLEFILNSLFICHVTYKK